MKRTIVAYLALLLRTMEANMDGKWFQKKGMQTESDLSKHKKFCFWGCLKLYGQLDKGMGEL